jgi:hypothetical protein
MSEREKPEQIPGEENLEETQKVISEQDGIPRERKAVNIEDYERVAALGQILKDLDFPANKDKIITFVKAYIVDKEILAKLEKIEDKEYKNVAEITHEAGLVYKCSKFFVIIYNLCLLFLSFQFQLRNMIHSLLS